MLCYVVSAVEEGPMTLAEEGEGGCPGFWVLGFGVRGASAHDAPSERNNKVVSTNHPP